MTARLSSPEVKKRLQQFSKRFRNAENEQREATMFWADFYSCFGISAAESTVFEQQVRKLDGNRGRIDSFIPGLLIVEHKSRGKDLEAAYEQAEDYFIALKPEERPKYIITSDFARIVIYDLETKQRNETSIEDLPKHASWFKFLVEGKQETIIEEREIDRNAAYTISKLHEALIRINFKGRDLEVFLTRLLFCLFADDTGIFNENGQFRRFVESAKEDGSDIGQHIGELFDVLNTAEDDRLVTLEDSLKAFPYINGNLFAERTRIPVFDSDLRKLLISSAALDWSGISPAIFGAMFQGVLEEHNTTEKRQATRRELGAHYTSERNILRVINPLFLEQLREDFETCKRTKNKTKLKILYDKLPTLTFFDPACGCGNFLVIAYRELRKLENDVIAELFNFDKMRGLLDVSTLCRVKLDQFYGIEIDEVAAHIARVALYITDHQLNDLAAERFGYSRPTIPLIDNPQITVGNALRIEWEGILSANQCNFVFGNPPFYGAKHLTESQRNDAEVVLGKLKNFGLLDYVAGWYVKAAKYMLGTNIQSAFVSTNSIAQGEQVSLLWGFLQNSGLFINFAHHTFKWSNEGKGNAAVHCVIIGFSYVESSSKFIFKYIDGIQNEPTVISASNINAYLADAAPILLVNRRVPLCNVPEIGIGNKPIDDGNYLLSDTDKTSLLKIEPKCEKYIYKWLGADEFINNLSRWCLLLRDCSPSDLRKMPEVMRRVEAVRKFRADSKSVPTQKLSLKPTRFHVENFPKSSYLVIPRHSSESRRFIPIGFVDPVVLCGDANLLIASNSLLLFGVLNSSMHMAWTRFVCGRIKSDFRYSAGIVYNNFIHPVEATSEMVKAIEASAKAILEARSLYPKSSLADLYDPRSMPVELVNAHEANDRAVDKAYSFSGPVDDATRVAFLFKLYEKQASILPSADTKKKRIKKNEDITNDLL